MTSGEIDREKWGTENDDSVATKASLERLQQLLRGHAGLNLQDAHLSAAQRRLKPLMEQAEVTSFEHFVEHLEDSPGALRKALELLLTHETYFFRERAQLDVFEKQLLPSLAESNACTKRLSVWSAGCSTGEEAYSVAIIIAATGLFDGWNVRVFGTDISGSAIRRARKARYRDGAFRTMQSRFSAFFRSEGTDRIVRDDVRSFCHFSQINLVDEHAGPAQVDVVFCRNVLIYLDDRSREQVIANLFDHLRPGGFLLLGHSESLFRTKTDFELVTLGSELAYQRPSLSAGGQK